MIRKLRCFFLKFTNINLLLRNSVTNKYVDEFFRNPKVEDFDYDTMSDFTITYKGVRVWISSMYMASPRIYNGTMTDLLPYADTSVEFFDVMLKGYVEYLKNKKER